MSKDSEYETPNSAKLEDNDEEKNEDLQSISSSPYNFEAKDSEKDESATDVEDKKCLASGTVPKYEWMKQRIKIRKQEVRIAEMKPEIIKHEIKTQKIFANYKRNTKLVY